MIRLWLMFAFLSVAIHFGITTFRKLTGKERWDLTKTAVYSIIVASLAVATMSLIVILF